MPVLREHRPSCLLPKVVDARRKFGGARLTLRECVDHSRVACGAVTGTFHDGAFLRMNWAAHLASVIHQSESVMREKGRDVALGRIILGQLRVCRPVGPYLS